MGQVLNTNISTVDKVADAIFDYLNNHKVPHYDVIVGADLPDGRQKIEVLYHKEARRSPKWNTWRTEIRALVPSDICEVQFISNGNYLENLDGKGKTSMKLKHVAAHLYRLIDSERAYYEELTVIDRAELTRFIGKKLTSKRLDKLNRHMLAIALAEKSESTPWLIPSPHNDKVLSVVTFHSDSKSDFDPGSILPLDEVEEKDSEGQDDDQPDSKDSNADNDKGDSDEFSEFDDEDDQDDDNPDAASPIYLYRSRAAFEGVAVSAVDIKAPEWEDSHIKIAALSGKNNERAVSALLRGVLESAGIRVVEETIA
jgi:hypothetical protein